MRMIGRSGGLEWRRGALVLGGLVVAAADGVARRR
jgi:hypothetical protein